MKNIKCKQIILLVALCCLVTLFSGGKHLWASDTTRSSHAATGSSLFLNAVYHEDFKEHEIALIEHEWSSLDALQVQPTSPLGKALSLDRYWPIGRELLKQLNSHLEKKAKRLFIKPGNGTCFYAKKRKTSEQRSPNNLDDGAQQEEVTYMLEVNIQQLKTSRVGCCLPDLHKIEGKGYFYAIGEDRNPGYIVLGHELCHALHAFENEKEYEKRIDGFVADDLPEKGIVRHSNLWKSPEEKLTVLGNSGVGGPQFSEFYLRLASGRLPRYAYQKSGKHFFESKETIESIMLRLLGQNWINVLENLEHRGCSHFNQELASTSEYNPWYIRPKTPGIKLSQLTSGGAQASSSPDRSGSPHQDDDTELTSFGGSSDPNSPNRGGAPAKFQQRMAERASKSRGNSPLSNDSLSSPPPGGTHQ